MTQVRYYYANGENQAVGPFELSELETMLTRDVLLPDAQVCPEGGLEWLPLDSLISGPPSSPPVTAPPTRTREPTGLHAKTKTNASSAAAAAVIFPVIMIILTLGVAANPILFAMERAMGTEFLIFLLFFAIGLFGPINAYKLLRVPGIVGKRPVAVTFAWIGLVVFVLALGLILLVGFSLEADMARRAG